MKRYIPTLICLLTFSMNMSAQKELKEISEIKRSLCFLYSTGTSTTSAEEASANGMELLSLEIEQWLKDNVEGDFTGYVAKSKNHVEEIKTQRGKLHRAFVYVKKSDILPYNKEESVMMVSTEKGYTMPVDTIAIVELPSESIEMSSAYKPSASEKDMLSVRNLSEINQYLLEGKKEGKILSYGKYMNPAEVTDRTYLYVFNRSSVLAVLLKNGETFHNVSTGQVDDIVNYGHCGVIWFKLNAQ